MKFICLTLLTVVSMNCFSICVEAQQNKKTYKEPLQITDASTGKRIPEVLVIPRYSSVAGILIAPEGKGKATYRDYLDKPFVYRAGEQFIIKKLPRFTGIPLFPVFIGKGRKTEGVLLIAPKYRPLWVDNSMPTENKKGVQLAPISDDEWSSLLEKKLNPLAKDDFLIIDDYRFWGLFENSRILHIYFNKKERELVHSFLQKDIIENK